MEIRQLSCPSCGGPLPVPSGAEAVTCAYCSAQLAVAWDGGQPDVRPDEALSISIEMSESGIRTHIRGRDSVVLPELRRDQLEAVARVQPETAPSPPARVAPPAPPARRRSRSPIALILIGAPLLVSGGVCLLLFVLAQLTGEGAPTENLTGFAGAVVLCPVPLLAMGGILTAIGALRYLRRPGGS